jgi:hypothetical protein
LSILTKIKLGLKLPPSIILKKAKSIAIRKLKTGKKRKSALLGSTYYNYPSLDQLLNKISNQKASEFGYFDIPDISILNNYREKIQEITNRIINHEFNLLGSGWVKVEFNADYEGFEGYKYSPAEFDFDTFNVNSFNDELKNKILGLIGQTYKKIDWQVDFRSGYRWNVNQWYKDIEYGMVPGADIKMPWELGRMQHLIVLAYSYILAVADNNTNESRKFAIEYENQVLDFIANNSPEFGVQWITSMDLSIRAINWLICYEYFYKSGYKFSEGFNKIFWESIYQHGKFITENLEWADGMRANHYLANITGLLFISAYLTPDEEINTWLAFSLQEFEREVKHQFYPDGGNFEASTAYHLLSSELVMLSFLITLKLGDEKADSLKKYVSALWKQTPKLDLAAKQKYWITQNNSIVFNDDIITRLKNIFLFGTKLIKNDGSIDQIGDNDSGRILKLSPYCLENNTDKTYFKYLLSGLITGNTPQTLEEDFTFRFSEDFRKRYEIEFEDVTDDTTSLTNVTLIPYKDFGLFYYHTRYYRAVVRCGKVGQNGKGGHTHNDQLSMTLNINGIDFIVDPGTYNYTAMPHLRNKFRSTEYHSTLALHGHEQNDIPQDARDGLFWLMGEHSKANVLKATENGFIGEHFGFRASHRRTINFDIDKISGFDYCNIGIEKKVNFYLAPGVEIDETERKSIFQKVVLKSGGVIIEISTSTDIFEIKPYHFSSEYGVKVESSLLILDMKGISSSWNIDIITI